MSDQQEQPPGGAVTTGMRFALFTCATILFIGMLYVARDFFMPIVLAILIFLTLSPIVRAGRYRGIPPFITGTVVVVGLGCAILAGMALLTRPIANWIQNAPTIGFQLRSKLYELRHSFQEVSQASEEVEKLAQAVQSSDVQTVSVQQPGLLPSAAGDIVTVIAMLGLTAILLLFLLGSSAMIYEKIVRALPTMGDKKRALRLVFDIERTVSRYLLSITLINAGLGVCVGVTMWVLGVPSPLLWGVAAAVLNYLPYVGNLIGIVLVAIVSIVSFDSIGQALLPPLAYLLLTGIEGQVVTPMLLGRRLELNAVSILVALAFWAWLWGLAGMLIAVPLLIVIKAVCDHFEDLAPVGEILSPSQRAYEQAEAKEQAAATPAVEEDGATRGSLGVGD